MANRVYGYQGYNKGYQYETSPKKLQPEFEPNEKQERSVVHKEIKKEHKEVKKSENNVKANKLTKADIKRRATFIAYIVFGFSVLFTISYRNSIINEKFNEKESLQSELTEIQKVNEQLQVSVENELNLTSVEKIAKEKLGMSKLSNSQKVYVNLPKKEYVESKSSEDIITKESESFYQKVYSKITEFFN
jgi:cell division protein FtsL